MVRWLIGLSMNPSLDSIHITLRVTSVLEQLNIPYFIGGSLAGIIYGEYRTTHDTDIVAQIERRHTAQFIGMLEIDFFIQSEAMHEAFDARALPDSRPSFNLIHRATAFKIDIFIATNRHFETIQFQRRNYKLVQRNPEAYAAIASAEDMILAKLEWYALGGRTASQQWRDVLAILKVQADHLDRTYLKQWATRLHVADLLAQAVVEAQ